MTNHMKQVAEMLGVDLEEEFELYHIERKEKLEGRHKLTESGGLMCFNESGGVWCKARYLLGLLAGSLEAKKLSYQPKKGDDYYTYCQTGFKVTRDAWEDLPIDYARLKCGMVFRTPTEASKARTHIYKKLTGEDWEEKA